MLQKVITGEVASVNQVFGGAIVGNAVLLLDKSAAVLLNRLLTDRPAAEDLDGAGREVITEVGNIVLNACLGVFGNLLQVQVAFTVLELHVDNVQEVLASIRIEERELQYALMIHTRFYLRASDVSGYLVIILGVTSLERLLLELKKWEERQLA
jgi:chemotaxis protein CheC